ncbi:conserved protein, unknown function [Hepatocystis sp. ex Piliocolobus tephrosceles]|nr:conserved protein, unknown function [Hepatocystis sp. ex Piliocolobus tephrosceles]
MYIKKKLFDFYKTNTFAFYLGISWFALLNGGVIYSIKYYNNFEKRHSYIRDAVNIAKIFVDCDKTDDIKIVKANGNIDSFNERAKCEIVLSYKNEKIFLNVNAMKLNKKKNSSYNTNFNDDEDDDFNNRDISEYIENPYLIKKEIKSFLLNLKSFFLSFVASKDTIGDNKTEIFLNTKNNKEIDKNSKILNIINNNTKWKINNIILVKKELHSGYDNSSNSRGKIINILNILLNNIYYYNYKIYPIYGNPMYNSYYYKYSNKKRQITISEENILKVILCTLCVSTALAIKRIYIYKSSYLSLNFVKNYVLNNQKLFKLLGGDDIQILSISGLHETNYLNSKIFLQTKKSQGVVHITATKNKHDKKFFVLCAKLLLKNETIQLDKG